MTSKIALVTGATRGIGLETVRQLAQNNVHVILAARDHGKGVAAAQALQGEGLKVEALALDASDEKSIAAAAQEVEKKHGRLDILVNNAGVLFDDLAKKPSEQTLDVWRKTFDTNVFGLVAVTQAFLPLLRKAPAARIVNVSSILGSVALNADPTSPIYDFKVPAYNVSKSAVNAWTVQLAHELRDSTIKVNAIHPGSVKTDMNSHGDIDVVEGAKTSVELALIGADGPNGSFSHLGQTLPW
ncbi:SDR family oxidoreductase [Dokdonella soli]|uniref:SDR family oxidoreductase n=1 Tax=Dokdonella soli TaxID=529810 RepID=A0ABN1J063_9GAMM